MEHVQRLIYGLIVDFEIAFVAMLALGISHSTNQHIPALGYWTTFWIVFALTAVAGAPEAVEQALKK